MASAGKTVAGTDGSDHLFREKVASQYKISAANKASLKLILLATVLPLLILFCHLLQTSTGIKLTNQVLPKLEMWEYVYLCSAVTNLCGYMSLQRNRAFWLSVYVYGTLLLSVTSLMVAAISHVRELTNFVVNKRHNAFLFGQPLPVLLYMFLIVALYINTRGMSCAFKLLRAWKEKGFKIK